MEHPKIIFHPKYGKIVNPSWTSLEECFKDWAVSDVGFNIVEELQKLPRGILIKFLDEHIVDEQKATKAWHDCFGDYYKYYSLNTLCLDELVYFIIQCDNHHGALDDESFWALLPEPKDDDY